MLLNAAGSRLARASLPVTAVTEADPVYTVTANMYRGVVFAGSTVIGKALFRRVGQTVKKSELDAAFEVATVTAVAPATGAAAGGTVVTITGTNLDGATGVSFGGVNGTAFTATKTSITVTAPAHAAGAVAVVIHDDSADLTLLAGYVYT